MRIINYISNSIIPLIITIIIIYGLKNKIKIFDLFLDGANEGIKIVYGILPTLIGLFVAIGILRASGLIDAIISLITPFLIKFNIPEQIMPLAILRPISRECFISNWNRYYENLWC